MHPELLETDAPEDDLPSCSVRLSLAAQGLLINDLLVHHGAQLLYELFSRGGLSHHGVVCNFDSKRTAPITICPALQDSACKASR